MNLSLAFSILAFCFVAHLCAQSAIDDLPTANLPQVGTGPALIIAVDRYGGNSAFADLPGIIHDWQSVKATVLDLGFQEADIKVLQNPSREEMVAAMDAFGDQARATRKASFLYFTGHGVLFDEKNYLIPAGAPVRVQDHLPIYAVPLERALAYLGGEESGPALVFLDACRNNSLPRTQKAAADPVMVQRKDGLFIGFATGEGRTSNASHDGSVFTTSLCKRLRTPGRSVDDIYAGVIYDVQRMTASDPVPQNPQKQSALRFVFHLVPASGPKANEGTGMTEEEVERRVLRELAKRSKVTLPQGSLTPGLVAPVAPSKPASLASVPQFTAKKTSIQQDGLQISLTGFVTDPEGRSRATLKITNTSRDRMFRMGFDWDGPPEVVPISGRPTVGSVLEESSGVALQCSRQNGLSFYPYEQLAWEHGMQQYGSSYKGNATRFSELGAGSDATMTLEFPAGRQRQSPSGNALTFGLRVGLIAIEQRGGHLSAPKRVVVSFEDIQLGPSGQP